MQFRLGYIHMVMYSSRMAIELEGKLRDKFSYLTTNLRGYSVHGNNKRGFENYFLRMDEKSLQFLFDNFIMSQIEGIQASYYLYYGLINFSLSRIEWKAAMLTYESIVNPTDKEFAEHIEARGIRKWKLMYPGQIPDPNDPTYIALKDGSYPVIRAAYDFEKEVKQNLLERMKTDKINTDEVFMKIAERTILPELEQELRDRTYLLPEHTNPDQKQE